MSSHLVKPTLYSALVLDGGETISLQFTENVYLSTSLDLSAITINAVKFNVLKSKKYFYLIYKTANIA